jgi:hypothetical protein
MILEKMEALIIIHMHDNFVAEAHVRIYDYVVFDREISKGLSN